ncbi:hypothetical protein GCM10010433_26060 [Streptomyces pulveraceus]
MRANVRLSRVQGGGAAVPRCAGGTVRHRSHRLRSSAGDAAPPALSVPGIPWTIDAHCPDHPDGRGVHRPGPQPRSEAEIAFVYSGPGTGRRLKEAGPVGLVRVRAGMTRAVEPATVMGSHGVDQALGQ